MAATREIVSKAEFARQSNVSPARVSQWLSDGRIKPASVVGEGRHAKIDAAKARSDLKGTLDPGMARNEATGGTVLTAPPMPERIPSDPVPDPADYRSRSDLPGDFERGVLYACHALAYGMPLMIGGALLEARVPMGKVLAAYEEQRGEYANLLVSDALRPLGMMDDDSLEHGPNTPKAFAGIALSYLPL